MKHDEGKKFRGMHRNELIAIIAEHFRVDSLLLEKAETLFDEMVQDKRQKKSKGILCDFECCLGCPRSTTWAEV
eukprot:scaffold311_cov173-Amphora_coffeaeformis.AAC.2